MLRSPMRSILLTLALLALPACSDSPDPVQPPAAQPAAQPSARSRALEFSQPKSPPLDAVQVQLQLIGEAVAENGAGGRGLSEQAVHVDIERFAWPGRAMEPELIVGQLRFVAYSHVSPTVLRYVVDGPGLLPTGAEASVRYGVHDVARFMLPVVER